MSILNFALQQLQADAGAVIINPGADGDMRVCDQRGFSPAEAQALCEQLRRQLRNKQAALAVADAPELLDLSASAPSACLHSTLKQPPDYIDTGVVLRSNNGDRMGWIVVRRPVFGADLSDQDLFAERLKLTAQLVARELDLEAQHRAAALERLVASLALLAPAAFLLDDQGGVIAATDGARALERVRIITQTNGRLRLASSEESRTLDQAISTVLTQAREGRKAHQVLRLAVRDKRPMCTIVVCTLPPGITRTFPLGDGRAPACWVSLRSPALVTAPSVDFLRQALGLTQKESEVARALMQGKRLETLAADRGVSKNAIKELLKGINRKTGCKSQTELVLLISALAVPRFVDVDDSSLMGGVAE